MRKPIYVTMPTLAPLDEVNELMKGIWESGIMTHNGPLVQRFEKEVCDFLKVPQMVSCCNGTLALQMAIKALGKTGEIITTPFTFIATISSIMWEQCTPVFVDIDPETLDIDASKIEERITRHTIAIMPVHVFGNNCDFEAIGALAKAYNLPVIYDACHSVGSMYKGESVFRQGDISVTSFHATKMLNTAEGGGIFTLDKEIDERLRRIRFFGFENHADIVEDGFNGKMTEVHAAVGIANLRYLELALADRKEKYSRYKEILGQNSEIKFQKITTGCNYSYFPAIFKDEETVLKVMAALNAENIFPRRYFYPSVNTFTKLVPYVSMPNSEDIASRILCLPLHMGMNMGDIEETAEIILAKL
ncbi:MAG: DegT/DnrJ/EryC1/StrS family aminotransferase [Bacteroidaceae bacterium]|nr:DegT/DnrJ/EryC1/StrS family aminotransferase [Bacteroidaceae bacterium]